VPVRVRCLWFPVLRHDVYKYCVELFILVTFYAKMYSVGLDYLCLRQWGQQLVQYSSEMRGLKGGHRVDTEGVAVAARLGRHEARSISCEAANGGCKGQFVCSGQGDHEGR
jgi:hypothetical protein